MSGTKYIIGLPRQLFKLSNTFSKLEHLAQASPYIISKKSYCKEAKNISRWSNTQYSPLTCFTNCHYRLYNLQNISNAKTVVPYVPCVPFSNAPHIPPSTEKKNSKSSGRITWISITITAAIGAVLTAFVIYVKNEKDIAIQRERKRSLGKAKIGGHFELIDHNGVTRKSEDFLGQWILLYFGFTHCPDICPDELEKMATVIDNIDKSKHLENGIQPLFITVDPERDSIEAIKKYVAEFHPKLLGLTGSVEKIAEACKAYRVYFSSGPKDEDNDYIVDHTIIIYLVDEEGNFVDYYGQTIDATAMTNSILLNIGKHRSMKKGLLGSIGL